MATATITNATDVESVTLVKTGPGVLTQIHLDAGAGETIDESDQVVAYDSTTDGGPILATISLLANHDKVDYGETVTRDTHTHAFPVAFVNGLTVRVKKTMAVTVTYT